MIAWYVSEHQRHIDICYDREKKVEFDGGEDFFQLFLLNKNTKQDINSHICHLLA